MDKDLAYEFLCGEQADFVEAVRGLDDAQWSTASLCEGWDVHDVTVHAACGRKSLWSALKLWASVGFGSPYKVNAKEVADYRAMPNDELVAWLATPITKGSATDSMNQPRQRYIDPRGPSAWPRRGLMIHFGISDGATTTQCTPIDDNNRCKS